MQVRRVLPAVVFGAALVMLSGCGTTNPVSSTNGALDTTPPAAPANLKAGLDTGDLVLSWDASADAVDSRLHRERIAPETRAQRHHCAPLEELPGGTFVLYDHAPHLVLDDALLRWTPAGYTTRLVRRADQQAEVITPPSLVSVLRASWQSLVPLLHPSARATTMPSRPAG